MSDALERLAARCGIAAEYHDLWGRRHAAGEGTRRALLAAQGLAADADPAALLRDLDDAEWRRPLPPVAVVRAGDTLRLPLVLPLDLDRCDWRWIATLEDGDSLAGEFTPRDLARLGDRRLDGRHLVRRELVLPPFQVIGYHRLEVQRAGEDIRNDDMDMALIVAPTDCHRPDALLGEGRIWGPAVQLYGLRSRRNWGIGDFTDLLQLIEQTARRGGAIVGVNPLHALFPDQPAQASPYSPSQRCFLNPIYLDVEAVPEFRDCQAAREHVGRPEFQARLRHVREAELVDYGEVAALKSEVLDLLYAHFRDHHLGRDSERARAFQRYRAERGDALEQLARFEVLQAHWHADDAVRGWPAWPDAYRDPQAPAVAQFADSHADVVTQRAWLQWLADEQLAAAGRRSWQLGLGVGLYQDLAVGACPGGAEVWSRRDAFAAGAHAGAPPDDFNLAGQDWGLLPFAPRRLRELAYQPVIDILRANMRHAGALRIDHVMGLMRLFWVPAGGAAAEGAYVGYPFEDLLGIVALESRRNRCLVIGEDLGTVPDGLRERLAAAGILSYRPFFFERDDHGTFRPPAEYPRQALAAVGTHDLPTLRGFWLGADVDLRGRLGLIPDEATRERMLVGRAEERTRFLVALEREQLLPAGVEVHAVSVPDITPALAEAIHAFLARSPAQILMLRPEDIFGVVEQPNLPGSQDHQHPNWRRRLPLPLEEWADDGRFAGITDAVRRERGGAAERRQAPPPGGEPLIPRATYRLQFHRGFTFADATAILPYLAELGISHCYASPYLKARPGSSHGYDIVDHGALNPEIGSAEDFDRFVAALRALDMHQIVDVVPNHMGVMGADNAWWLDVLENGPASASGRFFDIDWEPLKPELHGKVLLPLLGDHYGTVLHRGELRLEFDAARGEFSLRYGHHRLPVDPASYPLILERRQEPLDTGAEHEGDDRVELQSLITAFGRLPGRLDASPARSAERRRDKEVHKRHLAALCQAGPAIASRVAANVAELNGRPGEPASFDALHALIRVQGYRLAYWRVAADEINYRRFFDVDDLAALRMEDDAVFEATHGFLLALVAEGKVDGLRIDHPDGLADPGRYFRRLQQRAGGDPGDPPAPALYLVIEKILAEHERLPDHWPIHGTTGYRFANLANGLLVDAAAEKRLTRIYHDFVGERADFDRIVYQSKRLVMRTLLASELSVLASRLARIAAASRETCDFTLQGLRDALLEVTACFPVYRGYVTEAGIGDSDRRHIEWAVAVAKKRSRAADVSVFDFVHDALTMDIGRGRSAAFRDKVRGLAMKFQQFSAPVMAKGLEDTAFYRYHRLVALNDVGGDPRRFGVSVAAYHAATRQRAESWPHELLATSTHDSKRSEDVRARLDVLSEMPAEWKLMLRRWSRLNRSRVHTLDGHAAPSSNDEYLIYQSLLGLWPADAPAPAEPAALDALRRRLEAAMIKAVREAKVHSSWLNSNADYEAALAEFIQALLAPGEKNLFLADFAPFAARVARHGLFNSLSLALLKLAAPGVPDIYQGCEIWQFNLMDPDNRRPIDYGLRQRLLENIKRLDDGPADELPARLQPLLEDMSDGRVKLHLIRRALGLRHQQPALFRDGDYLPLGLHGPRAEHACTFARCLGDQALIAVAPRLTVALLAEQQPLPCGLEVWRETAIDLPPSLAGRSWRNVLTDERLAAGDELAMALALASFPVALLIAP